MIFSRLSRLRSKIRTVPTQYNVLVPMDHYLVHYTTCTLPTTQELTTKYANFGYTYKGAEGSLNVIFVYNFGVMVLWRKSAKERQSLSPNFKL